MINKFKKIYKKDSKGKTRVWWMETQGAKYRSISGLLDGKLVTSAWTLTESKNEGRSNATTPEEQAIAEVESMYRKKLDGEYKEQIDENIGKLSYFKPMLAAKWEDVLDKIKFEEGVFVQPKLDGIRCVFTKDGPKSRTGKPIVAIPHIVEELKELFDVHPDLILDGELYNHELKEDFNAIISMVRKTKPTTEDIQKCKEGILYHVYDIPSEAGIYNDRYNAMNKLFGVRSESAIVAVDTTIAFSKEEVDELYGKYLIDGYEGGIIRLNASYEQKRSKSLLKRKDFEDEEFEIIRIEEGQGNWAGYAKRVVFRNNDGREVGAGLKGNQTYAKKILEEAEEYIGKQVTVQFFTRTPDGVPRFPVAKALHKDKRW